MLPMISWWRGEIMGRSSRRHGTRTKVSGYIAALRLEHRPMPGRVITPAPGRFIAPAPGRRIAPAGRQVGHTTTCRMTTTCRHTTASPHHHRPVDGPYLYKIVSSKTYIVFRCPAEHFTPLNRTALSRLLAH